MSSEPVQRSQSEVKSWAKDADWKRHKTTISTLYLRRQLQLKKIMEIMEKDHQFFATERMFKTRIKAWELEKNLRPDEVLAMARVQARCDAEGKVAEFWRYGRVVRPGKLERFLSNHPHIVAKLKHYVPEDALMKGYIQAILPPHIVVLAPMSPLRLDDQLHSTEAIIIGLKGYLESCPLLENSPRPESLEQLYFYREFRRSSQYFQDEHRNLYNNYLQEAYATLEADISAGSPEFISYTIVTIFDLKYKLDLPELARSWVDCASQWCIFIYGQHHPWNYLFEGLKRLPEDEAQGWQWSCILSKAFLDVVEAQPEQDVILLIHSRRHFDAVRQSMMKTPADKALPDQKYLEFLKRRFSQTDLKRAYLAFLYLECGKHEDAQNTMNDGNFPISCRFSFLLSSALEYGWVEKLAQCKMQATYSSHLFHDESSGWPKFYRYFYISGLQNLKRMVAWHSEPSDTSSQEGFGIFEFMSFLDREMSITLAGLTGKLSKLTLDDD